VSFQRATDDTVDKRVASVGRILPHLEVRIVDVDGSTVPVGEKGELCTRGYSVMQGYWNDPGRTADAVRDGWMHTGDLATIDEQGYCNIVGRVKDMVIRGGENVYPREVEEYLFRHPKVAAVQVFGVPDTARSCAPGSSPSPARTAAKTRSAPSAASRSRTTRCHATSASCRNCRSP
jgi:fatty-acyl-CoA synthase